MMALDHYDSPFHVTYDKGVADKMVEDFDKEILKTIVTKEQEQTEFDDKEEG